MTQEIIDNIVSYLLDITKLGLLVWGILGFPQRFSKKETILIFLGMLGCNILSNWIPNRIRYLLMMLGVIFAIGINLKSIWQSFLCIPLYFLQVMIDTLVEVFVLMLINNHPTKLLFSYGIVEREAKAISDTIIILFYLFLSYLIRKKKGIEIKSIHITTSLFTGAIIFIFLFGYLCIVKFGIGLQNEYYEKFATSGFLIVGLIFILLLFYLLYMNHKEEHYKEKMKFSQEQMHYQKQYYESLLKKENQTKRFRHDIKAHINCLMGLLQEGKMEEAKSYLLDMSNLTSTMEKKIDTGNETLNFIVSNISEEFPWISLQWKGAFPENVKISDPDLCMLFSNLLKNSCESQELYKNKNNDPINTIVYVYVKNYEEDLFFSIENNIPAGKVLKIVPGKTSKKEKESHGYGLYNIYQVVQKYQGKIDYKQEGELITTEIYFKNIIED